MHTFVSVPVHFLRELLTLQVYGLRFSAHVCVCPGTLSERISYLTSVWSEV